MGYYEKWDPKTGKMVRGYVIETIADHAKQQTFHAHCNECEHSKWFDLDFWIKELGPDYPMDRFRKRLTCIKCGSKNVRLLGSHSGRPKD